MKAKGNNKSVLLFVCTGNTCRSPMAEQIFNHFLRKKGLDKQFRATSAGISASKEDSINPHAVSALINLGIKPKKHRCQPLTRQKAMKSQIIICMSKWHKEAIFERFGISDRVYCFSQITGSNDVPDPFGMSVEKYISCANYFDYACEDVLNQLNQLKPQD